MCWENLKVSLTYAEPMQALPGVVDLFRIYSLSRKDPLYRAKKTFGRLIDVVIQSAAAYALISLWYAIETVVPETPTDVWILIATDDYFFFIFPIVAGASQFMACVSEC